MAKTGMRGGWLVAGLLLMMGCAHSSQPKVVANLPDEPYRIGREDVLDVSIWKDADLSRVVPVRPDGYISLPIAGEVIAAGKTPTELSYEIKTKLAPYVQDPMVTVIVHEVNSSKVYITGEVQHPGSYPLRGRVDVLQAIALAGGFNDFANANGIVIIREGEKGGRIPIHYKDIIDSDDGQNQDVFLRPGDTIVVP